MASIFSWDDNPPRVTSPWLNRSCPGTREMAKSSLSVRNLNGDESQLVVMPELERLEAEPQEGPIEYKLHLLLRPRRNYKSMSTGFTGSGSQKPKQSRNTRPGKQAGTPPSASNQTRQHRLEQLTTQLLWRLEQSSPYHSKAKRELVIPKLPEDCEDLAGVNQPGQLLPGLEESNGALYEIGVSDDGTLVGLTNDEMDESVTTLKAMAASLGCRVEVQLMKLVGNCEWVELEASNGDDTGPREYRVEADLWVAEALVMPILEAQKDGNDEGRSLCHGSSADPKRGPSRTEQLRVSLIGPTTSGKTTILGTLANGTLDNGRGSSRINLLKHRHEVVSGQTSSVAQELIGYKEDNIFNYAGSDIDTWTDIHDHAEDGRLVFFSDSAGHLRFRRTILRGLVGWAPHWVLLCISTDAATVPSGGAHPIAGAGDDVGSVNVGMDLALSHLKLCLKLEIPTVIVVTKYDLRRNSSSGTHMNNVKETLSPVVKMLKDFKRGVSLIVPTQHQEAKLSEIPADSQKLVEQRAINDLVDSKNMLSVVPVLLTSAVSGSGIGNLHALLRSLPMPPTPTSRDYSTLGLHEEQPSCLFHIDDKYELVSLRIRDAASDGSHGSAIVVAGYVRFGSFSIGDKIVVGPFPADEDDTRPSVPRDHPSPGHSLSVSHPSSAELSRNTVSASTMKAEWHTATIANIRNLRLPVRMIEAGQAGTIQIVFGPTTEQRSNNTHGLSERKAWSRIIRKGQILAIPSQHMVETGLSLQAATGFSATFRDQTVDALQYGTLVNVYVATVRASARVLKVIRQRPELDARHDVFGLVDQIDLEESRTMSGLDQDVGLEYLVTLELLTNREWIELGSRVVLMEGGGTLDGYVGKVVEVAE